MKDLKQFTAVKQALEKIVSESDVNNGTSGMTLMAHFWQQEYVYDKARQDIQTEIAKMMLQGMKEGADAVKKKQAELEKLPKPKIVMEFKLLQAIPLIRGTKVIHDGDNHRTISMENITSLFVPEDAVHLGLLQYEETEDVLKDAQGRDTTVIKLHLKKGLIDIAAPIVSANDKVLRPKRAYVTAISYKAMQTAGELMYRERNKTRRTVGFDLMMNNPL
jgi:hypothetical protein